MTFCRIIKISKLYRTNSITQAVRDVLESDWLLVRMLQSGVANSTALATKIKPTIEKRVGGPVSVNTVVAALTRLFYMQESELSIHEEDKLPPGIRLSLSDSVFDLVGEIQDFNQLMSTYENLRESAYVPFGLYLTSNKCRFYVDNNSTQKDTEEELPAGLISENRFTKIKIDFPSQLAGVPNTLIYEISSILYKHQIDVHSAFFTPSGIVLIVENNKAAKLYETLHESFN
jgi:hypothetical protein